jgi:hypothetical protein
LRWLILISRHGAGGPARSPTISFIYPGVGKMAGQLSQRALN